MAIKVGDIVIDREFKYPTRCRVLSIESDGSIIIKEMSTVGFTLRYKKEELHFLKKK